MKHKDALFGRGQSPATNEPVTRETVKPILPVSRLVHAMDVELTPQTFEVLLRDTADPLIHLSLIRLQIYQIVEIFSHWAKEAGRKMSVDATWVEPRPTRIVFN